MESFLILIHFLTLNLKSRTNIFFFLHFFDIRFHIFGQICEIGWTFYTFMISSGEKPIFTLEIASAITCTSYLDNFHAVP